jgi:hypothetical protein
LKVSFQIAYGVAAGLLFVLVVFFGTRTIEAEPQREDYPAPNLLPAGYSIRCESSGECYFETYDASTGNIDRQLITPELEESLNPAEREHLARLRNFESYDERLADNLRLAFAVATAAGVLGIAAAVWLFRRVETVPLGLMLGGIGSLIYGWVQYMRVPGEADTAVTFGIVTAGLVLVLAGGYWFLGRRPSGAEAQSPG